MNQLNKNYIRYLSSVNSLKNNYNNIFLKKYYYNENKVVTNSGIISTCMIRGRLKKTYKTNKVSRHIIRDEVKKNYIRTWSIRT